MLEAFLLILLFFQIKHWYVDFVNQTMEEVHGKGIYLNWQGIKHSLKHGLATVLCVMLMCGYQDWIFAVIIGLLDFITHYHIDWTKMNYGNRDIQNPKFWNHLGLDQMAHQIVYIFLGYLVVA
jgi:Protein of unknown function (DUF3307)